jgi:hypothetical protein
MYNSILFAMKYFKQLFIGKICLILFLSTTLKAQFPEFKYAEIGHTDQMLLGQSSLADIDKDGDLDLVVGSSGSFVWWFEFLGNGQWKMHLIGEDVLTDKGGVTMDVNDDGLMDQVSGGTWFRNPGTRNDRWERFENGVIYSYDNITGDFNGDGFPELVAMSPQEGLYVYFIGSNAEKKWKKFKIDDGTPGGIAPQGVGDIDGDGDMDIVRSDVWYENTTGLGNKWNVHRTLGYVRSTGEFARSSRIFVVDMDGDKDMDVIQAESNTPAGRLVWQENKDGKGVTWYMHPIATDTKQDLHSLCVADFDNDGDLDVFSGGGPMTGELYKRCFIWENADGLGTSWTPHEVLFKIECTEAVAADIDGDGDIDICGIPWKDDTVYWLQNMLIESKIH